ncbi:MAG: glycosyltransferase [Phycisphaerae bacterium]|nr:glycosyltransferase [Phycisphaerae bacterium]
MRVCFIAHTNSPWAPYYAQYLQSRGHDVHVISFHPKPIPGIRVHYVGADSATGELPKFIYLLRARRVRNLIRTIAPDVVMATYVRSNGLIGALTKRTPLVISSRGTDGGFPLPKFLQDRLLRWIGRRADLLHASSAELAEALIAIGLPAERFTVFPLGTDPAVFAPRCGPRDAGPPRIICTRKHDPIYDNETIVRALARLRDARFEFEFRFVGSGTTIEKTRSLVRAFSLDDRVRIFGDVDHVQVPDHLRWADVYVSAAKSDGAPSSLFEAMSCRVFPVVTDIRANRDWLRNGENGLLFPVGDDARCAEALRRAATDAPLRERAGEINRRTIIERLDRNRLLEQLESLLQRAIKVAGRTSS